MSEQHVGRRAFMQLSAAGAAAGMAAAGEPQAAPAPPPAEMAPELADIPNFCGHEHWGSIMALGTVDEGFRADVLAGALPSRPVTVWDLVMDPYGQGWLISGGSDPRGPMEAAGKKDFFAWWEEDPAAAFAAARPLLERHRLTGVFRCTARGIRTLHGVDIGTFDPEAWSEADRRVAAAYTDIHGWHAEAMKRAGFDAVVRPGPSRILQPCR